MKDDWIISLSLLPILLCQALYVRKVTPELPEAKGERRGVQGKGDKIRLLILGDSAAAGVGVEFQRQALTGQLTQLLAKQREVEWSLWAESGHSSQDAIAHLQDQPAQTFDLVVTSLGVNDVLSGVSVKRFVQQQSALLDLLTSKFGVSTIVLTSVPPMHLFPALPQPLRWFLGRQARRLNNALEHLSKKHSALTLLSLQFPIEEAYFATDGFHPSEKAYRLWASAISELLRSKKVIH